jgi:hypothetical protein
MLAVGPQAGLAKNLKPGDWNDVRIRCEGSRIQVWINDFQTAAYTEREEMQTAGVIGLKLHGGGPKVYQYRNIVLKELANPTTE